MNPVRVFHWLAGLGTTLLLLGAAPALAQSNPVQTLRDFVASVDSGRASFTQTVTSSDGLRKRSSSGQFEFQRPNRFRFAYAKPVDQLIVADGSKVWIHDRDLDQASSRPIAQALGATPAALLAGGSLDSEFTLSAEPSQGDVQWVKALPRAKDTPLQSLRVGLRGKVLVAFEIVDGFGQRSLLSFNGFEPNAKVAPELFRFVPPAGTAVVEQ